MKKTRTFKRILGTVTAAALSLSAVGFSNQIFKYDNGGYELTASATTAIANGASLLAIAADGEYQLTADITIDSMWTINNNITLDLNDKKLNLNNYNIYVKSGKTLTIKDTATSKTTRYYSPASDLGHGVVYNSYDATLHPYSFDGGYITGGRGYRENGTGTHQGGAVFMENSSNFNLEGGNLVGNACEHSDSAPMGSGTVYMGESCIFTMNGGSILASNNGNPSESTHGVNGAAVQMKKNASFTMTGGEIKHCSGGDWSAACAVQGPTGESGPSTFIMSGGTISDNIAKPRGNNGKAVVSVSAFTMTGGSIINNKGFVEAETLKISGNPIIKDNVVSTSDNTIKNVALGANLYITVTGALTEGAQIGVTKTENSSVFTNSDDTTYNDVTKFFSDDATKGVKKNTGNQLEIADCYNIRYDANGATSGTVPTDETAYISEQTTNVADNTGSLAKTGYEFAGWTESSDGTGTVYNTSNATITMNSSKTLYAKWTKTHDILTYLANGATSGTAPDQILVSISGTRTINASDNTGTLAKTGFIFKGWNTKPDGSGTHYNANAVITMTDDLTLYAEWAIDPNNVYIKLGDIDSNGKFSSVVGNGEAKYKSLLIAYGEEPITDEKMVLPTVDGFEKNLVASTNYSTVINMPSGKTPAEIAEYLKQVTFEKSADHPGQTINVTITDQVIENKAFYFEGTGHYYQFVEFEDKDHFKNWVQAYNAAKEMTFAGRKGYLVTITSAEEDAFVRKASSKSGWYGATRISNRTDDGTLYYNYAENDFDSPTVNGETNKKWYWACGPERGKTFYMGESHTVSNVRVGRDIEYDNWDPIQPDASGTECCLTTFGVGTDKWNDLGNKDDHWGTVNQVCGFFVEYGDETKGDRGANSTTSITDTATIVRSSYSLPYEEIVQSPFIFHVWDNYVEVAEFDDSVEIAEIPAEVDGKPVTEIGDNSFNSSKKLKKLVVPSTVTTVGSSAFWGSSIEEVDFPESVKTIGKDAFKRCKNVKKIVIRNRDCSIDKGTDTLTGTVYGYRNSTAQKAAEDRSLEFVPLDPEEETTAVTAVSETTETTVSVSETTVSTMMPLPDKPTNIKVDENGLVTWDKANGAVAYEIYKEYNNKTYRGNRTEDTQYQMEFLPEVQYTLYVRAYNEKGEFVDSDPVFFETKGLGIAEAPETDGEGNVTWKAVEKAVKYKVVKEWNYITKYGDETSELSYKLKRVPSVDYKLYIRAYDENGNYTDGAKLAVKGVCKLGRVGVPEVDDATGIVTWKPAENAVAYRIVKKHSGLTFFGFRTSELEYQMRFNPNAQYDIYIRAYDEDGNYTNGEVLHKAAKVLGKVTDAQADENGKVTWSSVPNAVSYKLAKVVGSKTYYTGILYATNFSFKNVPKSDYKIFVVAFDKEGNKTWGKKIDVEVK